MQIICSFEISLIAIGGHYNQFKIKYIVKDFFIYLFYISI